MANDEELEETMVSIIRHARWMNLHMNHGLRQPVFAKKAISPSTIPLHQQLQQGLQFDDQF